MAAIKKAKKARKGKALPRGKMVGRNMKIDGGPWAGETMFIPIGGTMVMRVGPYHGLYTNTGVWKDVGPS